MTRFALPITIAMLLAGCARSEDASVVADSNGVTASVERVRAPPLDDEEMALGTWRDSLQDEYAALEFGPEGAPPVFSLRCDGRRGAFLQRHGTTATGDLPTMLVTVGSDTRRFAVTSAGGTIPMLRATLTQGDPFRQTLAGADSPIVVRIGDSPPLVLPPSDRIAVFIDGCASPDGRAAPREEPAPREANSAAPAANGAEGQ
jgi:hypothetical protein